MNKKFYAYTNKAQKEIIAFTTKKERDNFILSNPCSTRAYPDYYKKAYRILSKILYTKKFDLQLKLCKICKEGQQLGFLKPCTSK